MKCIEIPSCRDCPYNVSHEANRKRLCLKTSYEITKAILLGKGDDVLKTCPLPEYERLVDLTNNKKRKKQAKKKSKETAATVEKIVPKVDLTSPMVQEVQNCYGTYLLACPDMKRFDVEKMGRSWYKACFIGIKHCGENVEKVLEIAGKSDFLNGRADGYKWKADFQWIFRPATEGGVWNADKILRGNYNNKPPFKKESAFKDGERTYGDWKK